MYEKVVSRDEKGIWYFRELKDKTLEIIEYRGEENVVIVPERIGDKCVSRIGKECFSAKKVKRESTLRQRMEEISFVAIPSNIKFIGKRAFSHCRGLWCVAIQEGLVTIEEGAFEYCDYLSRIVLPDSVVSIGAQAFMHCELLNWVKIPEKVTVLKEKAFYGCYNLKYVVLPSVMESIGVRAFCNCRSLWNVYFPDNLKVIGQGAFEGCKKLKSNVPDSVETIGDSAFSGCESLADENGFVIVKDTLFGYFGERDSVNIPRGVRVIGACAFEDYQTMVSVFIPDTVMDIEACAFNGCTNLRSVMIPNSVEQVGVWAFHGCESLRHVVISKQITRINSGVFMGCRNLLHIVIPEGVTSIENQAFYDCESLRIIHIPESVKNPYWLFNEHRSTELIISAPSGSDAQWYAENNGISFEAADTPFGWVKYSELLAIPINEMDLSLRTFNCMKRAGIHTVGDLLEYYSNEITKDAVRLSGDRLMKTRNMGKKSLDEILGELIKLGLNVSVV